MKKLDLTMDAKTSNMLEDSIKAWEKIVIGEKPVHDSDGCPLCRKFLRNHNGMFRCDGCPVKKRTGKDWCQGSPYYNRHIRIGIYADTPERKAAALEELKFLMSLREPVVEEKAKVPEKKRSGRVSIIILKDGTPRILGCVIENKTDVRGISPGIESKEYDNRIAEITVPWTAGEGLE